MEKYLLNIDARQAKDKWRLNKRKVRYELTHWKRLWCWEGLGAGGEGDDRGWDGWMASLTRWTWVWVNSGSWWWTGRPGVLWFMGSQRVGHDWATELNWTEGMEILNEAYKDFKPFLSTDKLSNTKQQYFLIAFFSHTNLDFSFLLSKWDWGVFSCNLWEEEERSWGRDIREEV